jgi:amphi-Trp domain-containing protein
LELEPVDLIAQLRDEGDHVNLIEHTVEERVTREAAADRLRALADQLSRHNEVSFLVEGVRHTVDVPDDVTYTLEIEVGAEGSEVEVELKW